MNYTDFLTRVIDDGKDAARVDYSGDKLRGALDGFDLCMGLSPEDLRNLYVAVNQDANRAHCDQAADYWYWRCRALEVEWVCNVVSAMLQNEGIEPICGHLPTARGVMQAARIIGVHA